MKPKNEIKRDILLYYSLNNTVLYDLIKEINKYWWVHNKGLLNDTDIKSIKRLKWNYIKHKHCEYLFAQISI